MSKNSIDNHPQKVKIIDRILAGLPVRDVCRGLVPEVSPMTIHRYKANTVKPLLQKMKTNADLIMTDQPGKHEVVPLESDTKAVARVQTVAVDGPSMSLFRRRLEKLYAVAERHIEKAESAVKLDKDGNTIGVDLAVMAPLLNQAHKNVEMLGRATGELEPQGATSVSIQIFSPTSATTVEELPRISYADQPSIEAALEPDVPQLEASMAEIGVLQTP